MPCNHPSDAIECDPLYVSRGLPSTLGHVVELGCGPYTQLQSILRPDSRATSITLVDPLVAYYQSRTRGCTYRDGRLLGRPVRTVAVGAEDFVGEADVLVMVSILQSVRDVTKTLQAAYNAIRPGGLLVFSDRVFDGRWDGYRAGGEAFWDVGHPCAVKQTVIDHFLASFEEVHAQMYTQEGRLAPGQSKRKRARVQPPSRRDEQIYFIGRKPRT